MFGTWSVITPSWLSGSWRSFLYSSSLYSCHLFLISSASIRSNTTSVLYWAYLTWNVPFVSLIFFKRFLVFPILLFCSISLHQSLRKDFLSLLGILWNSSFRWIYFSFPPLLFTSLLFSAMKQGKGWQSFPERITSQSKHPLPTTEELILQMGITRWSILTSDWLYSL